MAGPGGIISEPGNPDFLRMRSRGIEASSGRNRNNPPNLVRKDRRLRLSCRTSATAAVVGREPGGRHRRPGAEPRKSLFLEDLSDSDWAERTSLVSQVATDVVYGQVLFAQGDDTVAEGVGLGGGPGPFGRYQEEVASRVLAELVNENSEAPRCVTEAASDLGTGDAFNEEARRASYWRWVALAGSRNA